jgi:hypothetical protein
MAMVSGHWRWWHLLVRITVISHSPVMAVMGNMVPLPAMTHHFLFGKRAIIIGVDPVEHLVCTRGKFRVIDHAIIIRIKTVECPLDTALAMFFRPLLT